MDVIHQHFGYIRRSKGHSAVAASAYRSGEKLYSKYDGKIYDFTKKRGIVFSQILLPVNAPLSFHNREILWNAVEAVEKNSNSQLAKEFDAALPVELHRDEQINLICNYVQEVFVSEGMCSDIAIHDKNDGNPHAHVMLTLRSMDGNGNWLGKWKKNYILDEHCNKIYDPIKKQYQCNKNIPVNSWNDKGNAEKWRSMWADACNRVFERKGLEKRVTHKSYARQGIEREPTKHLGRKVTALIERGIATERSIENYVINARNSEREQLQQEQEQIRLRERFSGRSR